MGNNINTLKTLIVVILYNKDIADSATIKSLNDLGICNSSIHIINNGPKAIELNDSICDEFSTKNNNISFFEYLDNKPLSYIYNKSLSYDYDRFILFDDDSVLDKDFFIKINEGYFEGIDLQLPRIMDKKTGNLAYPKVRGETTSVLGISVFNIPNKKYFYSIGSGLIIYKNLLNKFSERGLDLFDERFALYGVDTSFFRRIDYIKKSGGNVQCQIISRINHSLSSTSEKMTEWRYKERLYDLTLSIKFYSKSRVRLIVNLIRALVREAVKLNLKNCILIMKTFLVGKHPRC
ncbi:hypothetical protein L0B07_12280 [Raoultella ornithinolytica]|uniref:hypothetical protein n=1 Tax=Raoultella ornithinolytica TaxID=54291 RepID=UPI00336A7333